MSNKLYLKVNVCQWKAASALTFFLSQNILTDMFLKNNDIHIKKSDFLLLPNILTYVRLLLVPVFIIVYMNAESLSAHIWAAVIIILSGATDVADGFIARNWNLVSDLGRILDPIADKAMQFAMMFCVVIRYRWVLLLIIIYAVKELLSFIVTGLLFTRGKHIKGSMWCGKVCTVVLFIVMLIFVVVPSVPSPVVTTLIGFAAAFMILSFFVYMREYFKLYIEYLNEQKNPFGEDISPLDKVTAPLEQSHKKH